MPIEYNEWYTTDTTTYTNTTDSMTQSITAAAANLNIDHDTLMSLLHTNENMCKKIEVEKEEYIPYEKRIV